VKGTQALASPRGQTVPAGVAAHVAVGRPLGSKQWVAGPGAPPSAGAGSCCAALLELPQASASGSKHTRLATAQRGSDLPMTR
jgi:hypothetical protein